MSKKLITTVEGRQRITQDPPYRTHRLGEAADEILQSLLAEYNKSVPDNLEYLLSRYDAVDAVRQVVGVGSVGMRAFLTLLEERSAPVIRCSFR